MNQIPSENTAQLTDLSLYAEEFTVGSGRTACLLIHGLGCGPIQMRELAETIAPLGILQREYCCQDIVAAMKTLSVYPAKIGIKRLKMSTLN